MAVAARARTPARGARSVRRITAVAASDARGRVMPLPAERILPPSELGDRKKLVEEIRLGKRIKQILF